MIYEGFLVDTPWGMFLVNLNTWLPLDNLVNIRHLRDNFSNKKCRIELKDATYIYDSDYDPDRHSKWLHKIETLDSDRHGIVFVEPTHGCHMPSLYGEK